MSLDTDWAWAAGFFDGEGHVGFFLFKSKQRNNTRFRMHMSITQKDPQVLHRWANIVGVGIVYGPYSQLKPSGTTTHFYIWRTSSRTDILYIAARLWPYLGRVKKLQFNSAIRRYREFKNEKNR